MKKKMPSVANIQFTLAEHGIYAMFGSRKGNGFWLYRVGKEDAMRLCNQPITGFGKVFAEVMEKYPESPVVRNNGKNSGNPCFWMKADVIDALKFQGYI